MKLADACKTTFVAIALAAASAPAQEATSEHGSAHHEARTTWRFTNMPVRTALRLIAEEGNFNLVVSDSVQGTVSLQLVDVTWEQALDVVLKLKGLHMRVDGNTRSFDVRATP